MLFIMCSPDVFVFAVSLQLVVLFPCFKFCFSRCVWRARSPCRRRARRWRRLPMSWSTCCVRASPKGRRGTRSLTSRTRWRVRHVGQKHPTGIISCRIIHLQGPVKLIGQKHLTGIISCRIIHLQGPVKLIGQKHLTGIISLQDNTPARPC